MKNSNLTPPTFNNSGNSLGKSSYRAARRWAGAFSAACVALLAAAAQAGSFTAGNLVLEIAQGTGNNATVDIQEITTAGSTTGLQNVVILGTGANAFRVSASAATSGFMALSSDGSLLTMTGANSTSTSNVNGILPRGVGVLTSGTVFSMPAKYTGATSNQPRCATTTDDSTYYITDQDGFYTNGETSPTITGNLRSIRAFGGTVYMCSGATSAPVPSVVSTVSGTTATSLTALPGLSTDGAASDFYMVSSGNNGTAFDILYILGTAGLKKYSLVNGTWVSSGTDTNTTLQAGYSIAAANNGSGQVAIYVTTNNGTAGTTNNVYAFTDQAGYNATINDTALTQIYTGNSSVIVKSVAFAPLPVAITTAGTLSALNTVTGTPSSTTTFTVSGASLTGNITVAAPTGFEISTASGSGYSSSLTLTQSGGSVAATTIYVRLAAATAPGFYSGNVVCSSAGVATAYVPTASSTVTGGTITVSGALTALSGTYGTASVPGSFTASGSSLANNITIAAPAGFEVSTTSGSGYSSSITLTESGGTIAPTTIYVRLAAATIPGTYSGNITLSSVGSISKTEAIPSSTVSQLALTVSGAAVTTKPWDGTNTAAITGSLVGVVGSDAVTFVGTGTFASTNDGSGIAVTSTSTLTGANASNYTLTQPTGLTGTITPSANLGSVALSAGAGVLNPSFAFGTTSYAVNLTNLSSITLTPAADASATSVAVSDNGSPITPAGGVSTLPLSVGANTITVTVTPSSGSAQTYTFIVTRAAPFTPGNLVVQQADNGSIQNTTITMVELQSNVVDTASSPVQTIQLPGSYIINNPATSEALRINGSGGTTGYLGNSSGGTLLPVVAANALTNADFTQTTAANINNRAVTTLDGSANLVFQAYYTGNSGTTGEQARAATTLDGTNWVVADKEGIYLTSSASPATTPDATTNMLVTKSFGGQVYGFSASLGVSGVTSGGSLTVLPGNIAPANYTDFYMISSGVNGAAYDICYVALGTSTTAGTINKYSLVGGSWVPNGSYTTSFGGRSVVASGSGSGAVLYLTGGDGGHSGVSVVKVIDTAGYNSTINVNTANNLNLYTFPGGATGPVPKGIAFAPSTSPLADLTVAVAAPFTVGSGANVTYAVTLANSGAANATGVAAQFTLPAGLTYVSGSDASGHGFTVVNTSGTVAITGGTLNAGTSGTINITASGPDGSYTIDAGSSPASGHGSAVINSGSAIAESNYSNDYPNVSAPTLVGNVPYLTVDTAGSSTALANGNFTYTLTAKNIGSASATNASIVFTLPAGASYVSGSDNGSAGFTAANSGNTVTFSGGTIAANGTETLTVTVNATTSTYRINTVNLPAGAAVISPGGNVSTTPVVTSITLPSGPDLVVTSIPNGPFQAGDPADSFTIYASNDGTTNETQPIVITGTLPTGFTYTSASGSGWTIGVSGQVFTGTYTATTGTGSGTPALVITGSVSSSASGPLTLNLSGSSSDDAFTQNGSDSNTVNVGIATPLTTAGSLIVTRGHYTGSASTITVGQTLPNGAPATASGAYPSLWTNETPDVSFGITAPVYMDVVSASPASPILSSTVTSTTNLTSLIKTQLGLDVTTSFSSKSEVGLNITPDGKGVTFMAYLAPALTLDVSNANTPYHDDPTSPLAAHGDFQHAVVQVDYLGNAQVTPVDAYSGDNSRNVILAQASDSNYYYYIAGSAGNSGAGVTATIMDMLAGCTGIQMIAPGSGGLTTAVGKAFGSTGSTTGYQLGYAGQPSDKTGKDMNLRGLTLNPYNNTLYASKGSGGSGVDTIYQIGSGIGSGTGLPTPASASSGTFTIPAGFPTTSGSYFPFGMYFANAYTLYVSDEGEVPSPVTYTSGTYTQAIPANNPYGGLQKWVNSQPDGSGTWTLKYTLQSGLNLGVPYGYTLNNYPAIGTVNPATGVPWQPANNGLRNMAARDNGDGTVTFYAVTSTLSGETDIGADPNQLVTITDTVAATTLPMSESFSVIEEADGLDVIRGVAVAKAAPVNTTLAAGSVTSTGATLSGSLNPNGTDTHVYFQYGTTTAYGQTTAPVDLGSGNSAVSFSFPLTGLLAGTTYHYRLVSDGVVTYYSDETFNTPAGVPAMPPWAPGILALGLMGVAAISLRRRKQDGGSC